MVDDALGMFTEGLRQLGLDVNDPAGRERPFLQQFLCYRQELLDSLSLLKVYDRPGTRLLDIGAGAGFPGLPLKIVRPDWQVVLLEATAKKVTFLQHVIETLQLQDVIAVHGRAEELANKQEYRAAFDVVTARAVASLATLLEYGAPFCRVGGLIILPKKGELVEELAQGKR